MQRGREEGRGREGKGADRWSESRSGARESSLGGGEWREEREARLACHSCRRVGLTVRSDQEDQFATGNRVFRGSDDGDDVVVTQLVDLLSIDLKHLISFREFGDRSLSRRVGSNSGDEDRQLLIRSSLPASVVASRRATECFVPRQATSQRASQLAKNQRRVD